jgi:hypothetical protein
MVLKANVLAETKTPPQSKVSTVTRPAMTRRVAKNKSEYTDMRRRGRAVSPTCLRSERLLVRDDRKKSDE